MANLGIHLVVLELTDKCNLNCIHCYHPSDKNYLGTTLSQENTKTVVDELQKVKPSFVTISGGEPLLIGERLFDIAKDVKRYCKKIFLTTNGQLIKKYPADLFNIFDDVQISLDGPSEIHEMIRGANTFKNAVESAKYLKLSGVHVTFLMTLNSLNKNVLEETNGIAKRMEIPFGSERMTPIGCGEYVNSISSKEWRDLLKLIIDNGIACRDPLRFMFKYDLNKLNLSKISGGCTAGIASLVITSTLDILPCVRLRIPAGNLKDRSLEEIWINSEILNKFRNRSEFSGKCGICGYRNICGGCRADAFALTGDYLGSDPICWHEMDG